MTIAIWFSPPCTAYSNITHRSTNNPKQKHATINNFNLRQLSVSFGNYYIIENVATCDDLYNPTKLNGYGFTKPINMERHFETNFPVPDKYTATRTKDYILKNGLLERKAHSLIDCKKRDLVFLKDAPEKCTVKELRSYIPPYYVSHILDNMPETPDIFIDCFCSVGGVSRGVRKYDESIKIAGIDMFRQDKYPYPFVHGKVNSDTIAQSIEIAQGIV